MRVFWSCVALLTLAVGWVLIQSFKVTSPLDDPALPAATILSAQPPLPAETHDVALAEPAMTAVQIPATENDKPTPDGAIDSLSLASSLVHAVYSEQACLAGTAKAAQPRATTIHRWTDASGIIHFSDQAPAAGASDHRRIETQGLPPIVVRASGYDVNIPDDLNQNAVAAAQAIERVLRDPLGVGGDPGLVLNIEFIASAKAWAERAGDPALLNAAGTYSTRDRTIHIRLQPDLKTNFLILRHEIAHALVHERIGRLPTALNEGLASYFENIQVAGMGAQIAISESRRTLASAHIVGNGQDELIDLLTREGMTFYAAGQEQRYRRAFGLVAMLMQTPSGRAALAAVLAAQRQQPCVAVAAEQILATHYPGGLIAMASAWVVWLNDPPSSVQAF